MSKNKNFLSLKTIKEEKYINKLVFIGISVVMLFAITIMSRDAGISGDEHFHVDQAEDVWNYITSFGKKQNALFSNYTLHMYGQSLDNIAHALNEVFSIDDIYFTRHLCSSVVGWSLILFTGLTAALLFGWRAGWLAILLIFFSPRILGHSFNNLKDIPLAASYMFTIYFILLMLHKLPKASVKTFIPIALGIAWAISIRIGGLVLIPYLFLFYGLYYLTQKPFLSRQVITEALKNLKYPIITSVVGYIGGIIFWPYALSKPVSNTLDSLSLMTNYIVSLNTLFEGVIIPSAELPWYYGIKYILISSPIIVLFGFILLIISLPFNKFRRTNYLFLGILFFAFAFPIAYTIYKDSTLYNGWRHLLWVYAPVVVLASGGFEFFLAKKNKLVNYGTLVLVIILAFHPIKHTFKNHPNQYIYYNQLVGSVKGAYTKYETDYYYHSIREGVEWLLDNKIENDSIIVITNHSRITQYYFRNNPEVKVKYCQYYEKGQNEWDYAIWANTHITPQQLEKGYWPPKGVIYTMDVDKLPIGCVVKRISNEDVKGFNALKQYKLADAKAHFKNFLALYPENEEVLEAYARALFLENKPDSTIIYADSSLLYNPRKAGAWLIKATALNKLERYDDAILVCNAVLNIKNELEGAYFQKGLALKKLNKPNDALKEFTQATQVQKKYYKAIMQMGEILVNYKEYEKALEMYSQVFKFKANDVYASIFSAKCHHLLKDNKKAIDILTSLPDKDQNNLEALKLRSRIAISKNDMNTTGKILKVLRNIGSNSDLFVVRALYVLEQNRIELAMLYLEEAIELDGINQEAKVLLEELQQLKVANTETPKPNTQQQQSIMFQKQKLK